MDKLLITLRHPGPADAILASMPELSKNFSISMIVTDSAINILKERFPQYLEKYNIYFPGKFIEDGFSTEIITDHFKTEFKPTENVEYEQFYNAVLKLVKVINPDISLRTTPAYNWGIDEIMPRIMKDIDKYDYTFCFQEYYGVGKALSNFENSIASLSAKNLLTVDKASVNFLQERGIKAIDIGWISHKKFKYIDKFDEVRKKVRKRFKLENHKVIMYSVVCCGSILAEVNHFEKFVKCMEKITIINNNITLLIKYHPRNNIDEIKLYRDIIQKYNVRFTEVDSKISYNEILTLPDIIYSAASNMNIDLLAYQYANDIYEDISKHVISVYSYDNFTRDILNNATGKSIIPSHTNNGGHVLVNDENMKMTFEKILSDEGTFKKSTRTAYDNFNGMHYGNKNLTTSILKLMG